MANGEHFFDFAADVGLTKHLGGQAATERLAALCHIGPGQAVLDVGCGAGATTCFLARHYRCWAAGIDILPKMIARSRERARREDVADQVDFWVADAQHLPFASARFDAVMTESVTAFPADKQRAVDEYARVTRPGGCVGLNESTWLQDPPPEMVAWIAQDVGGSAKPLRREEWVRLLENAGLTVVEAATRSVEVGDELRGLVRRYGTGGMLRIFARQFRLILKSPAYRQFVKQVQQTGVKPENLEDYLGYGLYIGRKV